MWTRRLGLVLLLNGVVLNGAIWLVSPPGMNETVLAHSRQVLRAQMDDDSWGAMGQALDYLRSSGTTPVYTKIFFEQGQKFQYPVSSLLPFAAVRQHVALVSTGFLILTILATWALFERRLGRNGAMDEGGRSRGLRAVLIAGLVLTFYPVVRAYTLGQIQVWLTALFAMGALAWSCGWRATAGIALGLIALVKPHYALFLIWAAIRREWRFVAGCLAIVLVGLAASLVTFGWSNHIDYLRVLAFISRHGESFHPNQSVNGLLNRLAGIGHPDLYDNVRSDLFFPPYDPLVHTGTLVTSVAILGLALWRRTGPSESARTTDFCIMGLSCTLASPIAWEHHYGILLPVYVVLFTSALTSRAHMLWLAVSYVLASNLFQVTNLLAPGVWNITQSYLFAGSVIALALLYLQPPAPRQQAQQQGTAEAGRRHDGELEGDGLP